MKSYVFKFTISFTYTWKSLSTFFETGVALTDTKHKLKKATIIDKGTLILLLIF